MWKKYFQATYDNINFMCFACWKTKATYRHSDYVLLIAFLLQQWLHESASLLRYNYIACLVIFIECQYRVNLSYCVTHKHWTMKYRNTKLH